MAVYLLHPGVGFFFQFPLGSAEIGAIIGDETAETRASRIEALEGVNEGSDVETIRHLAMNRPGDSASEKADPSFWARAAAFDVEMAAKIDAGCFPWM